jgi:hypothetical protein
LQVGRARTKPYVEREHGSQGGADQRNGQKDGLACVFDDEMIAAERDRLAPSQGGVRHADAVDEGAVGGFEIANPPTAFLADDLSVVPARLRLLAVRKDDVVVPTPPDPHARPAEDRVLSPARPGQESESKPGHSRGC